MIEAIASKAMLFEERASSLLDLLLPHRQFEEAIARYHEFDASAAPDYWSTAPFDDDDRSFRFTDDDDELDGDSHVQALMAVGPPGTGKSGFLKWIARLPHHASVFGKPDGDIRPLISLDVPDPATPKEVVREICTKLRSPPPVSWTRNQISRHLRKLFRDVRLRYLQMDEAHVLAHDVTARQQRGNARFLKFMLVSCRVPIILAGEEPLESLLQDRALARRMQAPIRLGPYQWGQESEVEEWLGLTQSLAARLGFEDSPLMTDFKFAMKLYLDTGGVIGLLAKRLVEAARFATREGSAELRADHFATAWQRWDRSKRAIAVDPFKITATNLRRSPENPYLASTTELKMLWFKRFHSTPQEDASRLTRRSKREPSKERGFQR